MSVWWGVLKWEGVGVSRVGFTWGGGVILAYLGMGVSELIHQSS